MDTPVRRTTTHCRCRISNRSAPLSQKDKDSPVKAPYSWLKDYVETTLSPRELAHRMTMAGLEAEHVTTIGAEWDKVYVGDVVAVTPHPDADRLVLAEVAAGDHRLTVVTGAPNIEAGQKVALALAGARLIDGYSDELKYKTLKPGNIRGIRSEGMVCSEKELGLSEEHEGILVLDQDAPAGVPLADYLGDTVIEFEITPNLVHAFSIVGLAREAGAIVDAPVRNPEIVDLSAAPIADSLIRIDAPELCSRYHAVVIDGVTVAPSPSWMARRLTAAGIRPVNNIVDITNYVMLELGQPLHAFDLSFLDGERIEVRTARPGESFETLDHRERALDGGELLICDASKPVALAGVMGGVNSEIVETTASILLESANFDMLSVRTTARAQRLQTDASSRFGRGLDPELSGTANARAALLVLDLCPGATIRAICDAFPSPPEARSLTLPVAKVERVLGMPVQTDRMVAILTRLGFEPRLNENTELLTVQIPSWRSDVSIAEDIIEEVARIVGYEQLLATLISGTTPVVERDATHLAERRVRQILVAAGGFEGRGYVTLSETDITRWSLDAEHGLGHSLLDAPFVRLRNAIPAEDDIMRPSIIPRLAVSVVDNLKHQRTVRLFEIGHVYLGTDPDLLPREPSSVAIALAGFREPFDRFNPKPDDSDQLDYFDAKGMVDAVLAQVGPKELEWRAIAHPALHPGRAAEIRAWDERLGIVAEVHPRVAREIGIEGMRLVVAELNLERILAIAAADKPDDIKVARFLPVEQDFAVVVNRETPAAKVQDTLELNAGPLLTGIVLFDVFEGSQIGEDNKSLAFRLTFTAPDRALTDSELGKVRTRIERGLQKSVNGTLRA